MKNKEKVFSENLKKSITQKKETANELLERMISGNKKNINPLIEEPTSIMRIYGYLSLFEKEFFDTEEEMITYVNTHNTNHGDVCVIDFLGNFADCRDVIRVTYSDNKFDLLTVVGERGYGRYNYKQSVAKNTFVWEYIHGDLKELYSAFRERGITFANDIYAKNELNQLDKDNNVENMEMEEEKDLSRVLKR